MADVSNRPDLRFHVAAPVAAMRTRGVNGFTLIELVVSIVILAVLAAVAVPRYIALGRDARIASLQSLAGTLNSTALNVRGACMTNPACDYSASTQTLSIAGRQANLNYGWLDAGDSLGADQIDAWINYSGFTASIPTFANTVFSLDAAPDPSTCTVTYFDAFARGAASGIAVSLNTGGC